MLLVLKLAMRLVVLPPPMLVVLGTGSALDAGPSLLPELALAPAGPAPMPATAAVPGWTAGKAALLLLLALARGEEEAGSLPSPSLLPHSWASFCAAPSSSTFTCLPDQGSTSQKLRAIPDPN